MELHGLKNSSRGTREMIVVDQSWLIGLSEKRRETQQQRDESSSGEMSPLLGWWHLAL